MSDRTKALIVGLLLASVCIGYLYLVTKYFRNPHNVKKEIEIIEDNNERAS